MQTYINTNVRLGDYELIVEWDFDLHTRSFVFVLSEDKPDGLRLLWRIDWERIRDYSIDMKQGRAMQFAFTDIEAAGGFGRLATKHLPGEKLREGNIAAAVAVEREACLLAVSDWIMMQETDDTLPEVRSALINLASRVEQEVLAIRARGEK